MNFWTVILVLGVVFAIVNLYKAKNGIITDNRGNEQYIDRNGDRSARDAEAQREIEELRERIKVLERIATDKNSEAERLASKIEDLRKD